MMIYIHAVDHSAQHKGKDYDPVGASRLEKMLESLWGKKDISVVAEEFSEEACEKSTVKASVCKEVSYRLKLQHIYCDPNSRERNELGIPTEAEIWIQAKIELSVQYIKKENFAYCDQLAAKYHLIREKFWLKKLERQRGENVIFICGHDHIDSFSTMLTKNGWEVETV